MSKARELWQQRQKEKQGVSSTEIPSGVQTPQTATVKTGSKARELWAQRQQEVAEKGNRFQPILDWYNKLISNAGGMKNYFQSYRTEEERDSYRSNYYQELEQLRQEISSQMNGGDGLPGDLGSNLLSGLDSISKALDSSENYYKLHFDLDAGQAELDALDKQIAEAKKARSGSLIQYIFGDNPDLSPAMTAASDMNRVQELQQLRSEKKVFLSEAKRIQEQEALAGARENADFGQFSGYQEQGDPLYEYINGKDNGKRAAAELAYQQEQTKKFVLGAMQGMDNPNLVSYESPYQAAGYDLMTQNEVNIYNYYYAKDGKEKAQQYLDSIQETLNYRKASGAYQQMEDHTGLELLFGLSAGLDQWESGAKVLFDRESDYIVPSAIQMASSMVREDLDSPIARGAYDLITTTANMAPSILTSMAANLIVPGSGTIVGNAMMFAGAAGNAYADALNRGYDKKQARFYSNLIGASEVGLQTLLGGISALGGVSSEAINTMLSGVDNAFLRIAGKLGTSFVSEGSEEFLQEVLTPLFENLALKTGNGWSDINWSEAAYAGLLGGLTGILFEGPNVFGEDAAVSGIGKQVMGTDNYVQRLQKLGKTMSADSVAYKLAGKIDENTGAYTIGRMFNELGASLTEQNQADIQASLESKGMDSKNAGLHAQIMNYIIEGGELSDIQMRMIEKNDVLANTLQEVIIDPHSTVYQRAQGYNQLLLDMAQKRATDVAQQTASEAQQQNKTAQTGSQAVTGTQATTNAKIIETQEPVTVDGVASVENGNVRVRLSDGQEAAISDVDLGDVAPIYEAAASVAESPETATLMVKGYNPNGDISAEQYAMGLRHAAQLGRLNLPESYLQSGLADAIPETIRKIAYGLGRKAGGQRYRSDVQQSKNKKVPKAELQNGQYLHIDGEMYERATDAQRSNIDAISYIADTFEIPIYIYESQQVNGKYVGANGFYRGEDGSIHIDINAGNNGEGYLMFTLGHELTHQIKDWSPEKFKVLADFVVSELTAKGVNVDELLQRQFERVSKIEDYKGYSEEHLREIAYEEMIASSMEGVLTDGRVIQKLNERDNSVCEFMLDFIRKIAEKIRKLYAKLNPDSVEGQQVARMKDRMEQIQDLWLDALEESSERYRQAQKNTAQEGGAQAGAVRYSNRSKYSYESLISKPDMALTTVRDNPYTNRADVIYHAKMNAAKVGKRNAQDGSVTVHVKDNGKDVLLGRDGLKHGLHRTSNQKTDPNYIVTLHAGEILQNAIQINELAPKKKDANGSYVLIGAAKVASGETYIVRFVVNQFNNELDSIDVLYAINAKKELAAQDAPRFTAEPLSVTSSAISIADLLDYVNNNFPDILPESVLSHYGHEARPQSELSDSVLYQERQGQLSALNESIRQEQEQLQEAFDETKAVFKILDISEKDAIFTKGSVTAVAQKLIKLAGAKQKTGELTQLLTQIFNDLAGRKNLTWNQAETALSRAVDWLMENRRPELDSFAQDVLDDVRGKSFYLDDQQKMNAQYKYGSYLGFRRSLLGTVNVSDNANMSLDSQWKEWARDYPSIFDPDTNSSDMPEALLDAIGKLRDMTTDRTMGFDVAGLRQELLREAYDGLIRAAVYPAEADKLLTWRDAKLEGLNEANQKEIRKLLQKHEAQMDKLRRRQEAEINSLKENYRKQQEWRKYSQEKTEIRHRIQRTVNQLNSMLTHETKNRHIPEVLKMAVMEALEAVNMDTVNAQTRIAELQKQIERTSDRDTVEDLRKRIETLQEMGGRVDAKLERLEKAYNEIKADADPALDYAFDEEVLNQIQRVKGLVGKKPLREMTKAELTAVDELYTVIMTRVRTMNEAFATEKKESISTMGKHAITEVGLAGGRTDKRLAITQPLRAFSWNNEKPIYAFERIGSDTLTTLFNNVRKGEDVWAQDVSEAKAFVREQAKTYRQKNWDTEKKYSFTSTNGKAFSLDVGQIMTLYAYSKRAQAWDHLEKGGFQIEPGTKVVEKTKNGVKVNWEWTTAQTFKVDKQLLEEIISKLTPEQKAYADAMQKYLSETMGEKGNEVSMKLYGIKLFKEKFYFPLKSSPAFLDQEANKAKGEVKIKSKGFTKQTQAKASNPVYLRPFMDVWADHVNEMSMYHGFTLPLEDLYRVRNYREGMVGAEEGMDAMDSRSVTETIQNAYGKEAVQYIEQLLKDLNGGAMSDPREGVPKRLTSLHKKAAVMASLSVIVQQPTALFRAMSEIDMKYFGAAPITRGLFRTANVKRHQQMMTELKTYAPVAIIKEMGYFDTNMGMSTRDYLQAQEYEGVKEKVKAFWTDEGYRDEVFGKLPSVADELAWVSIWEAVKKEQAAKGYSGQTLLEKSGERFTEVIARTQVYDSVLSRSANMRSKGVYMSMATSFMAEPTTTANMIENAIRRGRKGDKKYARRVFGAVLGSNIINAALVSFVYAMRDDDEDETFTEKYLAHFTTEAFDGINPITYIPFARDIWSVMQGFDVERADMTLVTDLIDAAKKLNTLAGKDTEEMTDEQLEAHLGKLAKARWSIVDILGSLVGFPIKNIRRDALGVKNLLKTLTMDMNGRKTTAGSLLDKIGTDFWASIPGGENLMGETKTNQLYDAIVAGDAEYVKRLKSGYKSTDSYNQAVRKALRENDGRIRQAAEARNTGDIAGYTKFVKEILAEGKFTQDDVVSAINTEINALNKGESTASAPKAKALYNADDFQTAILSGDSKLASSIRDEIIRIDQVNGKTKDEAEKSFQSSVRSRIKDAVLDGSMTDEDAKKALSDFGGLDDSEAEKQVSQWEFEKDYGYAYSDRKDAYLAGKVSRTDMLDAMMASGKTEDQAEDQVMVYDWLKEDPDGEGITASSIEDYNAFCAGVGITKRQYREAWQSMNELEADYDENGKTIQNSRTQKVMAYINGLALHPQQKTALALTQYKASTVEKYRLW